MNTAVCPAYVSCMHVGGLQFACFVFLDIISCTLYDVLRMMDVQLIIHCCIVEHETSFMVCFL